MLNDLIDLPVMVETENTKRIKKEIQKAVLKKKQLAIVSLVGAGKTHMYNHLLNHWSAQPNRFLLAELKGYASQHSRAGVIMSRLITAINPDITPPRSIEDKHNMLQEMLRIAERRKKEVILAIDEAQDLSLQTFRDIKKIHEIFSGTRDHLFSVLFFGKEHQKWKTIFRSPELADRIRFATLGQISEDEAVQIAERRFKTRFENQRTKERFKKMLRVPITPLSVESLTNYISTMPNFTGTITEKLTLTLGQEYNRYRLKAANLTQKEFSEIAQVPKQDVSRYVHGQKISVEKEARLDAVLDTFMPPKKELRHVN